jgi:hypothetical protein
MPEDRLNAHNGAVKSTAVASAWEAGRQAHAGLHADEAAFGAWLQRCPANGTELAAALPALHVADLYLACACAS